MKINLNLIKQKEEIYRREISRILYDLSLKKKLPSSSVVYCCLFGEKKKNLNVYLDFYQNDIKHNNLFKIKKNYYFIKKEMMKNKKKYLIPNIFFYLSEELNKNNKYDIK